MAELLELEGVWAGYGDATVLEDISLRRCAPAAAWRCSGATAWARRTLARHADGRDPAVARRIRFDGQDLRHVPSHRRAHARPRLGAAGARHLPVAHASRKT